MHLEVPALCIERVQSSAPPPPKRSIRGGASGLEIGVNFGAGAVIGGTRMPGKIWFGTGGIGGESRGGTSLALTSSVSLNDYVLGTVI